ncbi:MAG: hypothetical protein M3024_14755 [Candidatus Dormibacteraeota bacterium]|nr:hypothetical protein [Candidatus Dormibacteraeota bacterium]
MTVPPLVYFAEVVLVLALAALAAALWLGAARLDPRAWRQRLGDLWRPFLERQLDTAQVVGLSPRAWLLGRLLAAGAGLVAGSLTGIWTITVGGFLLGLFALPWLLAGRAATRRLQMERALAGLALSIRNLMQHSNLALDRALREAARSPAPELGHVLRPLTGEVPVADALVEVAKRARSPLADMLVTTVLIARTHNPAGLITVTDEVLLPLMAGAVSVQEENHATLAQQRSAAIAIGVIMCILFAAVMRVPTMREYYSTVAGQFVLILVLCAYLGLVWLIGHVTRPMPWAAWDVDAIRRESEALVG